MSVGLRGSGPSLIHPSTWFLEGRAKSNHLQGSARGAVTAPLLHTYAPLSRSFSPPEAVQHAYCRCPRCPGSQEPPFLPRGDGEPIRRRSCLVRGSANWMLQDSPVPMSRRATRSPSSNLPFAHSQLSRSSLQVTTSWSRSIWLPRSRGTQAGTSRHGLRSSFWASRTACG